VDCQLWGNTFVAKRNTWQEAVDTTLSQIWKMNECTDFTGRRSTQLSTLCQLYAFRFLLKWM